MVGVTEDAPPRPDAAVRLTAALATHDDAVNGLHDALNDALPWLWTPLAPPRPDEPLAAPHHALYALHAGLGIGLVALAVRGRTRTAVAVGGALLGAASWAVFTGAWNRRAAQAASAARRDR